MNAEINNCIYVHYIMSVTTTSGIIHTPLGPHPTTAPTRKSWNWWYTRQADRDVDRESGPVSLHFCHVAPWKTSPVTYSNPCSCLHLSVSPSNNTPLTSPLLCQPLFFTNSRHKASLRNCLLTQTLAIC